MSPPIKLAVVVASVRKGRFGPRVAAWFAGRARQHGSFDVDVIDLIDFPLPLDMSRYAGETDPAVETLRRSLSSRLADADAYALVTPEYNHTFSPALANVLNWCTDEWRAKPAGLVSYGGRSGGLRATEHLRQVLAELHLVPLRDTLSFHNDWDGFADGGCPDGSEAPAKVLLDQLVWWGTALREARGKHPFGT
ncbi:NADPH-dependent FMN reductase [Streptomyces sp. NPDC059506]|uniref:NADPH-dependent FMN reductase n=1 Tax=Streptomyces TaxID=1883 RepID=UPI0021751E55|nr:MULTISPECIES: NAD(P)H-dependent oxidoreductase [unclassified Streptomyces]MCZ2526325.1 NAD(P)H-dependent oxidoreductase [Streptomyces sp. HB2AG]